MRCMASTTRGARCRREGAKDGDMRRYCVQHGRMMREREREATVAEVLRDHLTQVDRKLTDARPRG